MNKTIIFLFLLLFFTPEILAQGVLYKKPPFAIGKVKKIITESHRLKYLKGKWVKDERIGQFETTFNQDKTRIESTIGENFRKEVFTLNSQGQVVEWTLFEIDGRNTGTKEVYFYDKDGKLSKIDNYLLGSYSYRETFTYLTNKNCFNVEIQFKLDDPKENEYESNCYDNDKNIVSSFSYDADKNLKAKEFYKYDKKGNPIEFKTYDSKGKLVEKETYSYQVDSQGNWINEISKNTDWTSGKKTNKYYVRKRTITYY